MRPRVADGGATNKISDARTHAFDEVRGVPLDLRQAGSFFAHSTRSGLMQINAAPRRRS